jgi:ketosteroid isomerase-like protein
MAHATGALVLAIGFVVVAGNGAGAQEAAPDMAGVEAANQAFYEAASARDLARMDAIWAHEPYVTAIHPANQNVDTGWGAVRAGWEKLFGNFTEISVAMPDPQIRVGNEVAWVTGQEQFRGRPSAGEEVSVTLLGTSVFEKSGGQWLMVHHHVSAPPPPQQ